MEPVGLAVGVLGLAGLFSVTLDAVDRFESWRNFTDESHLVRTLLEGQKLRLRLWGRAVGFDDGHVSATHHEALDDSQIRSIIRTHLSDIEKLCTSADGIFLPSARTGAEHTKGAQPQPSARPESKRQRLKWALRDKAKCTGQVQMLASFVQALHDLVPLDGLKGPRQGLRNAENDAVGLMDAPLTNKDPLNVELDRIMAKLEAVTRKDIYAWLLNPHVPNAIYEDAIQKRVDGTFDWILTRRLFLDWTTPDFPEGTAKILWINGPAGFGKTILCARVVEHLCSTLDPPPAYFFFSSDFGSWRDPFVAVRSWLTQILSHTVAFNLVQEEWESQSGSTASQADVVKIFRNIIRAGPSFTFVLDGLDECAGADQAWDAGDSPVAKFLGTIQQAVADTPTRIMIVSRGVPEIRQCIVRSEGATLFDYSLSYDDVRADTESYASSIVEKKLRNKEETMRTDISLRLAERCKGQFLWIKLQEPFLRSGKNKKQLEAAINTSPAALDHLYDREWQRLLRFPTWERSRAVALLRWAAFSLHPLTVAEITEALLIHDGCDELPHDEMPDSIDQDYVDGEILGLCGSLVEIRNAASESSVGFRTVHLAHFSVREFFSSRMLAKESTLVANENLRTSYEATQNNILAMMCLRYLNFRNVWLHQHEESNPAIGSFLNYAAGSWYKHAAVSKPNDSALIRLTNDFFRESNEMWQSWRKWYDMSDGNASEREMAGEYLTATPLYYASRLGLKETVAFLLREQRCSINDKTSSGTTALAASCGVGDVEIVAMLLDAGASITIATNHGWTPLNWAADKGHADVVKLLLAHGADANVANDYGWAPLHLASLRGHVEVVRLLLYNKADINTSTSTEWTPLHLASEFGNIEVIQLLLREGADIGATMTDGWESLHLASHQGFIEVVRLLLDNRADIAATTDNGWAPLHLASRQGYVELARLLLEKGADPNAATADGWAPLHIASEHGYVEVIRLLLKEGVDSDATTADGWTSLHISSKHGHAEVVRLLLEKEANISATTGDKWASLHLASENSHIDVAQLLLEKGADINAPNGHGCSALQIAAQPGHIDMVKLLLENRADGMAKDLQGWTPLDEASYSGHAEIAKLLLEKGSLADVVDDEGRSAFFYACARGHMNIIELLSLRDVAAANRDRYGATPLFAATRNGHEKIVAHLLSMECDYGGFVDGLGQTLLWWASKSGNAQVLAAVLQLAKKEGIQVCDGDLAVEPRSMNADEYSATVFCDCCTRYILKRDTYLNCTACSGGNFVLCVECLDLGAKCHDGSHELRPIG